VAARLAELAELHRRANQPEVMAAELVPTGAIRAASSPRKPVVSAHVYAPELVATAPELVATAPELASPAPELVTAQAARAPQKLEALYAASASPRHASFEAVPREDEALLLRLTELVAGAAAEKNDANPPGRVRRGSVVQIRARSVAA
jgi:hypothetical protein